MSAVNSKITEEVTSELQSDKLELPVLPEIALAIRESASDEDISARKLAEVISQDPVLSARLIKTANSALFRASNKIEHLPMAISRMGVQYAANLATGLAMQHMFQATTEVIDRRLRESWSHATEIASLASVNAKYFTRLKVDQATLAGLTHNIGVLPILSFAERHDGLLNDAITLERVIESMHPTLGTQILSAWDFPEDTRCVPENYANFEREDGPIDYIDVVQVAYLQSLAGSNHPHANLGYSQLRSFRNLGLDPAEEHEDLADEMAAAMDALNG
jgi:HD-like signal output (HDOD) protein